MTTAMDGTQAGGAHEPAVELGANLRVSLACPKCGVTGWVKWASLKRAIHCPKCQCEFLLTRDGQLHSLRDLPQVRFACPRCGKSGWLPSTSIVRKAECGDCKLPLVAGPDQRLHGVKEAAQMQREAVAKVKVLGYRAWLLSNLRAENGRAGKLRALILAAPFVAALCVTAAVVASFMDGSPQTLARKFTRACLADDRATVDYLEDDPVQTAELERFRMRNFASLLDKYRPSDDRATVEVAVLKESPAARVLEVSVTSEILGTRRHEQIWHQRDGRWWFDAQRTLAAQDAVASKPAAQLPRPQQPP